MIDENQYTIHHEFSEGRMEDDTSAVNSIKKHIEDRSNPFTDTQEFPISFSTGKKLEKKLVGNLIENVKIGEEEYVKFKRDRLENKSVKLLDRISNVKMTAKPTITHIKMPDIRKETTMFLRIVEIARMRSFDLHSLLCKEITTTSFFLLKDGFLRKPQKSDFAREVKECCKKDIVSTIPK